MKTLFSTLLLVLLLCTCVSAHVHADTVNPEFNRVIARSGLTLRAEPSLAAAALTVIPFNETVDVLSTCDMGFDTIGALRNLHRERLAENDSLVFHDTPITGVWVMAAYGQDTGYLFNAYLYSPSVNPANIVDRGRDFIAFRAGYELDDVLPVNFNYYGVYGSEGNFEVRSIRLSYVTVHDFGESFLSYVVEDFGGLHLIIGTKGSLPEHRFTGHGFVDQLVVGCNTVEALQPILGGHIGVICEQEGKREIVLDTYVMRDGQEQSLGLENVHSRPNLSAIGDIDGDGHPDFLTWHDGEMGYEVLHLSGSAAPGKLTAPAAILFASDCC